MTANIVRLAVAAIAIASSAMTASAVDSKELVSSAALQDLIKTEALHEGAKRLADFAELSTENGTWLPSRHVPSQGFDATLDYIVDTLKTVGDYYEITRQNFTAEYNQSAGGMVIKVQGVIPKVATNLLMSPQPLESIDGHLVLVKNRGCKPEDYPASVKGQLAFIQVGECSVTTKSVLAGKAGARAAMVRNNQDAYISEKLDKYARHTIPSVSVGKTEGDSFEALLAKGEQVRAQIIMDETFLSTVTSENIIAQTRGGDGDNCLVLGAHSGSQVDSPGLNDNGSGVIALLETAVQLAKFSVNNCVRFVWFGAEDYKMLGSQHYVKTLTERERQKVRVYVNQDSMASLNFVYQVNDGLEAGKAPAGSFAMRDFFADWYRSQGLGVSFEWNPNYTNHESFSAVGIPTGGFSAGSQWAKTEAEAKMFGGTVGEQFDPNFHSPKDDLNNLNMTVWHVNTRLLAHTVATFGASFEGFPERECDDDN